MTKKETKAVTIRLPLNVWKELKTLIRDGEIKSIQRVVVGLLKKYLQL